jgi:hypothetical protein
MARVELLSSEEHRELRLQRKPVGVHHFVQIVPSEFSAAAACCPILFTKNAETGRFIAGAMFGFRPDEDLISHDPGASRAFSPIELERQGFFISDENIAVDLEHPRVSDNSGDRLFDDSGEPQEPMQRIQRALGLLKRGTEETDTFIQTLLDLRLIEPIDISLRFDDGEQLRLDGLYTVSLDALHELDDASVLRLFRNGYLRLAYCVAESLKQIPILAHRRNQRLAGAA